MRAANVLHLGMKELRSLLRDPIMIVLIVYAFTFQVYTAATAMPETLHKAPIAIVDEDRSPLSARIIGAFYPPYFLPPAIITQTEMDVRMDAGLDTFALYIPSGLERDVLAGRTTVLELAAIVGVAGRVVCADTGVAHLATALRRPSVVLFGPTAPAAWGPPPDRPWHRVLWAGVPGDGRAAVVHPGLLRITVSDVLTELDALADTAAVGA